MLVNGVGKNSFESGVKLSGGKKDRFLFLRLSLIEMLRDDGLSGSRWYY